MVQAALTALSKGSSNFNYKFIIQSIDSYYKERRPLKRHPSCLAFLKPVRDGGGGGCFLQRYVRSLISAAASDCNERTCSPWHAPADNNLPSWMLKYMLSPQTFYHLRCLGKETNSFPPRSQSMMPLSSFSCHYLTDNRPSETKNSQPDFTWI